MVAFLVAFEPPGDSPGWPSTGGLRCAVDGSLAQGGPCTSWPEARPAVTVSVCTVQDLPGQPRCAARGLLRLALTVLQWRGYQDGSRSHAAAAATMRSRLGCRLHLPAKRAHQGQGPASQPNPTHAVDPGRHRLRVIGPATPPWSPGYPGQDLTIWPTTSTGLVIRRGHDDSAFFDRELWLSSPSQATSCRKIRYSSRIATTGDHA